MNRFSIQYYNDDKGCEMFKYCNDFAEYLIISICRQLGINPQSRHLFGLYHSTNKIWICNNEQLTNWKEVAKFEFRIRFRPFSITKLRMIDVNAFNYYFQQIRYDFINGKFMNDDIKDIVHGLAITDMVRVILQKNMPIDTALDCLDLGSYLPSKCRTHKKYLIKQKINASLLIAWSNSKKDVNFVIQEYMDTFLTKLVKDYGVERYEVVFDNHANLNEVEIQYKPSDGISIKSIVNNRDVWDTLCTISDLCFISLHKQNNTIELSRKNGIPFYINFRNDLAMKSFLSLLDGYYRLTENWCFNICKDVSSPSLDKLKSLKCHGPVTKDFSYHKLKLRQRGCGTYILRESMTNFDQYKLDVIISNEFYKTFKIVFDDNKFKVEGTKESYASLSELKSHLMIDDDLGECVINLKDCIPLSEYDQPYNLLLCRPETSFKSNSIQTNDKLLPIIPTNSLKLSRTTLTNNSRYGVRLASLNEQTVIVKEVKSIDVTNEFLKTVSQWSHLRNDTIVSFKGVTLYMPLSLILEYLPMGPLDAYLNANQPRIKEKALIESAASLANALYYLQENNIIHGHIRCHNLFVVKHFGDSLKVKLSDPISDNDVNQERAWLPPEYFISQQNGKHLLDQYIYALDVWSYGTTVWQIFSYGDKPNCDAFDLVKPNECPNQVWSVICECWIVDCDNRKDSHTIIRDINQIFYELYNSHCAANHYSMPIFDSKKAHKPNVLPKVKSIFGSQFSISSSSLVSAQTTDTVINATDSSIGPEIGMPAENGIDNKSEIIYNNEPWLIDRSQVEIGRQLGEGCYGQVSIATLKLCFGLNQETVAVKRIKSKISVEHLKDMKREIEIMKKLSHKNIVEIKGFVDDEELMLVMEYVQFGSLVSYLQMHKSTKKCLPLLKFASDIAKGMEYLQSKSIIHRDLAARNILVASNSHVKISDFGLAQYLESNNQYYFIHSRRELPVRWYAPETLNYCRFSHRTDIWSFGVVLWEMYTYGDSPLYPGVVHDSELASALENGLRLLCPVDCPLEVFNIMQSCWHFDSHLRPTFTVLNRLIENLSEQYAEQFE